MCGEKLEEGKTYWYEELFTTPGFASAAYEIQSKTTGSDHSDVIKRKLQWSAAYEYRYSTRVCNSIFGYRGKCTMHEY